MHVHIVTPKVVFIAELNVEMLCSRRKEHGVVFSRIFQDKWVVTS